VEAAVHLDRQTIRVLAAQVLHTTAWNITKCVCTVGPPQMLTDDYEQQHMALLQENLHCYQADGNAFIWWISVVDYEMQ
jgi:hypothetical protein